MSDTAKITLEDFIKKYNLAKKPKKSYAQWLTENGDTTALTYSDSILNAQKEYDRASSGYGKKGETLSRNGLIGSGYASFLDANAYSEFQNAKNAAEKERKLANTKNNRGYAEYLEKEDAKQTAKMADTINSIFKYKTNDYENAYKLAISSGLNKNEASIAAIIGTSMTDEYSSTLSANGKRVLLMQMKRENMSEGVAYNFALACGLSEKEAKELAHIQSYHYIDKSEEDMSFNDLFD